MFEAQAEAIDAGATKIRVGWNGGAVSARSAFELCRDDEGFRSDLIRVLARSPFGAFFWETPPITAATAQRPFEFVLTEARGLAHASPEVGAFSEYFARDEDGDGVVAFDNLGGDAKLVVPCPVVAADAYAHLAAFAKVQKCRIVTFDRDFLKFPDVDVLLLSSPAVSQRMDQ